MVAGLVTLPALLGLALGYCGLKGVSPTSYSWTLIVLNTRIVLGCCERLAMECQQQQTSHNGQGPLSLIWRAHFSLTFILIALLCRVCTGSVLFHLSYGSQCAHLPRSSNPGATDAWKRCWQGCHSSSCFLFCGRRPVARVAAALLAFLLGPLSADPPLAPHPSNRAYFLGWTKACKLSPDTNVIASWGPWTLSCHHSLHLAHDVAVLVGFLPV